MVKVKVTAFIIATIILLIAIIFPYFIIFGILNHNSSISTINTFARARVSDIYSKLKTGDLIMFAGTARMPIISGICQTFFTHAAMVIRQGDLVYITEAQYGESIMPNPDVPGSHYYMKPGTTFSPILTRLKFYSGQPYVMQLSKPLDLYREDLLKKMSTQLLKYPYPTNLELLYQALFNGKINSRHCFMHVAHLLDLINLSPIYYNKLTDYKSVQVCRDICNLSKKELPEGYYYEDPIELLYDIGSLYSYEY